MPIINPKQNLSLLKSDETQRGTAQPKVVAKEASEKTRRGQEDQERDRSVYRYLLSLTDLSPNQDSAEWEKPNESAIAKQWGMEDNRIFVRRVLRSTLHQEHYSDEEEPPVPGLTLGKLVKILTALDKYRQTNRANSSGQGSKMLTCADKRRALRLFGQLTLEERQDLRLDPQEGETLLQKLIEDATDPLYGTSSEVVMQLYRTFLNLQTLRRSGFQDPVQLSDNWSGQAVPNRLSPRQTQMIRDIIDRSLNHLLNESENRKHVKQDELYSKVVREIYRIDFQSGQVQAQTSRVPFSEPANLLTPEFIERLTRCVVENEILTDEFPVRLKYFEVEKMRPLPLSVKQEPDNPYGLLNAHLIHTEQDQESIYALETQYAFKIKVFFDVKCPDGYELKFKQYSRYERERNRLRFSEEISGVGSPISFIIAAISKVLLWDIPCLHSYLPFPKLEFINEDLLGGRNTSPVMIRTLVRLCRKADVRRAIDEKKVYEKVDPSLELAHGEYCGFDMIEAAAKSALYAVLRAIKQTNISPQRYFQDLCYRVEELNALQQSESLLDLYPFSLFAMEGSLRETIFNPTNPGRGYCSYSPEVGFQEVLSDRPWSQVAYEAHLKITEAYLEEGLYRAAKQYLDALSPQLSRFSTDIDSLIFSRYYLCQFMYRYLSDLQDEDSHYSDRYQALRSALESLDQAEKHLKDRVFVCQAVDELIHTNIHPFSLIYSRIYAYRANLYIHFPTYAEKVGDRWETLLEPIRLLEQARIYAAKDGNPTEYAYHSAYQSWCYLMLAYLGDHESSIDIKFNRQECLDWAARLLKHALLCYAPHGKRCYQEIKNNGGRSSAEKDHPDYDKWGNVRVQIIPFIRECYPNQTDVAACMPPENGVLSVDLSILKQINCENEDHSVYLFGTQSSTLLLAIGIQKLCQEADLPSLISNIQEALKVFTYCWATAKDGGSRSASEGEGSAENSIKILDRIFEKASYDRWGCSYIQGIYPHRISVIADLGLIWMSASKLLKCLSHPKLKEIYNDFKRKVVIPEEVADDWKDIDEILKELQENSKCHTSVSSLRWEQRRYNGFLADHYGKIDRYFRQFKEYFISRKLFKTGYHASPQLPDLFTLRSKVVRDLFRLIRGEIDVEPTQPFHESTAGTGGMG